MRNWSENKFWDDVRSRLQNYTEEPDDELWGKISGTIPKSNNGWIDYSGHLFTLLSLLSFLLLIQPGHSFTLQASSAPASTSSGIESLDEHNPSRSETTKPAGEKETDEGNLETSSSNNRHVGSVDIADKPAEGQIITDQKIANQHRDVETRLKSKEVDSKRMSKAKLSSAPFSSHGRLQNSSTAEDTTLPDQTSSERLSSLNMISDMSAGSTIAGSPEDKSINGSADHSNSQIHIKGEPTAPPSHNLASSLQANKTQAMDASDNSTQSTEKASSSTKAQTIIRDPGSVGSKEKADSTADVKTTVQSKPDTKSEHVKESKKKKNLIRGTLYFALTPTLGYHKLTPDQNDNLMVTRIRKEGMISSGRLGMQFEAGYHKMISRKFEFAGGLNLFSQRQTISYEYVSSEIQSIESDGTLKYTLTPSTAVRNFDFTIRAAGVNASVFYLLKNARLSHRMGAGLQYQKAFLTYTDEGSVKNSKFDMLNYMILYRMQLAINRRMDAYVQPSYSHALFDNELPTTSLKTKPYRVGIGLGVLYRF